MATRTRTTDAVKLLHRRYVKGEPARKESLRAERLNVRVAAMIYRARTDAGMSQAELADRIGTTQSVISRLEDADYHGHSLTMLSRIATALNRTLSIAMQ